MTKNERQCYEQGASDAVEAGTTRADMRDPVCRALISTAADIEASHRPNVRTSRRAYLAGFCAGVQS
jgi:hypothetical protein